MKKPTRTAAAAAQWASPWAAHYHFDIIYKLKQLQAKIEKNKNKTFFFDGGIDDRQYIIAQIIDGMKLGINHKFSKKFLNQCNIIWDKYNVWVKELDKVKPKTNGVR